MPSKLQQLDLEAQLSLLSRKSQCTNVVCPGLEVPAVCGGGVTAEESRCLVEYGYPMKLSETLRVAEDANYESVMTAAAAEAGGTPGSAASSDGASSFKPDWRFWTGLSLSGLGIFLYRSR